MTGERDQTSVDQLESLGRVFAELVHDLANDIVVLQGWARLARGEADAGRVATAELDRVVELAGSVGSILRDLLTVAEGGTVSPEVGFSPRAVTEATVAQRVLELSSRTVRLRIDISEEARVHGFASFWARILGNLLSNAARHARGEVLVELRGVGHEVVLRVEDDGPGVDIGARARIFEPLYSGEGGGVGLGLSSVAWLAERLGGEIRYDSSGTLGGAAFEVRVPLTRDRSGLTPSAVREVIRGLDLMLIDDDESVRRALGRLLRRVGAEVRELDPGSEAEERLLDIVVEAYPDVLLLDLRLGQKGGTTLWRKLKDRSPELAAKVIFVSGAAPGDPDWEDASTTGQPLLGKPFHLQQLAEAVTRLS
jgi:CheY-like chemotaxis protein